MPTSLQNIEEDKPHRPPLPPVEGDQPAVAEEGMTALSMPVVHSPQQVQPTPIAPPLDQSRAARLGRWFYAHPDFMKERSPLSYLAYQFGRATFATIPYGAMMALGQHAFTYMSAVGQKLGLKPEGVQAFTNAVSQKKGGLPAADLEHFYKEFNTATGAMEKREFKAVLGRTMMRVGNSPMNAAVQIAMGFTLFRFVGGIVKNVHDRILNEKNTEQDTINETKNWWQTVKETARINWKAESSSTPIAALVLGFMNAAYVASPEAAPVRNKALYPGIKGYFKQVKEVVFNPKAKLAQNAAVWTLSYSLFFLLAECLFKDVQLRRGLWKGHPNSLKNGPDDIVGGPGAIHYNSPEEQQPGPVIAQSAENGYQVVALKPASPVTDRDKAQDNDQPLRYPILTAEPSIGRFWLRRVPWVCLGISAYAGLKRAGYLAAGGPMTQVLAGEVGKGFTYHAKKYLTNYWREAAATTMFGALWTATDAGGNLYDKFFQNLQKPENKIELTPEQQRNHAQLLQRLNTKEMAEYKGGAFGSVNDNAINDNHSSANLTPHQAANHTELLERLNQKETAAARA